MNLVIYIFISSFLLVNTEDTPEKCNHVGDEVEETGERAVNFICGESEECRKNAINPTRVIEPNDGSHLQILVFSKSNDTTDSLRQCLRSAGVNDLNVKVLTADHANEDDDRTIYLVKKEIKKFIDDKEKIVLFTESYEVLFLATAEKIITEFKATNALILFAAEATPSSLEERVVNQFPNVDVGRRFLSSRAYIGYARYIYALFEFMVSGSKERDQTFFTKSYLKADLREELEIKLDSQSNIFHILNDAVPDEVVVTFKDGRPTPLNTKYDTKPLLIIGDINRNAPAERSALNYFGNYLPDTWNEVDGCSPACNAGNSFPETKDEHFPSVVLAIFVEHPIPFLDEFLQKIDQLDYPKERIHLFVHNAVHLHETVLNNVLERGSSLYASVKLILPIHTKGTWEVRKLAIDHCIAKNCDYYFSVDGEAHFDNPLTLQRLIEQNRGIVAPLLPTSGFYHANFWGMVSADGLNPLMNVDYMDIVMGRRKGIWNVPFISHAYLVNGSLIKNEKTRPNYVAAILQVQPHFAFCHNNRDRDIFMYLSNREVWGHLVNSENFWGAHKNNEMYEIIGNRKDWEARYLHPSWSELLNPGLTLEQPCHDVYRFPLLTERFCKDVIQEAENLGTWFRGDDPRAEGNAPSVDINLEQLGLNIAFAEIHRSYVLPLQRKVWLGYEDNPRNPRVSFVSRYKPDELAGLRPHEDDSLYSTNLALNEGFEGGGVRFIKYNCSIVDNYPGYMLMHPGSASHYHESLKTTAGTRYILVSFIKG